MNMNTLPPIDMETIQSITIQDLLCYGYISVDNKRGGLNCEHPRWHGGRYHNIAT